MGPLLVGLSHDLIRGWTVPLGLLAGVSVLVGLFAALAGRFRVIGDR